MRKPKPKPVDDDAEIARLEAEDEAAAVAAGERDERETAEAKTVLLDQAKALGMEVDGRWSVDTLAEKVLEAQVAKADADKAAFEAEEKVMVFLIRDCWPLDVRHYAGETIGVPRDIAARWCAAGAARLA